MNEMAIYIQEALKFTERVTPMLHEGGYKTITHKCPHCDAPVKYPLVAREVDVAAFASLLQIAEEVLKERGVHEKILDEIYERIKIAIQKRHGLDEGKDE
jgi:hypothetical protein